MDLTKLAPGTLNPVCPAGTTPFDGLCFEATARPAAPYVSAIETCTAAGRLLPQVSELIAFAKKSPLPSQEWSGDLVTTAVAFAVKPDGTPENATLTTPQAFRCVAQPSP